MAEPADTPAFRGPVEDREWPQQLPAHVIDPGPPVRLHGYEVARDLARHYTFAEVMLTALCGTPPRAEVGRVFEAVVTLLLPISVARAPTHCATLVRRCGAPHGASLAAGATALCSWARELVERHADLLAWLDGDRTTPLPPSHRRPHATHDASVSALIAGIGPTELLPDALLEHEPTADALLIAAAYACGLREPSQLESMLVCAGLPGVAAELGRQRPGELQDYPIDLPHFAYVPPPREDRAPPPKSGPKSEPNSEPGDPP